MIIFTAKRMYPEAIDAYFESQQLNMTHPDDPAQREKLREVYAAGGIRAFWRSRVEMLLKPIPAGGYTLAKYHARLGEPDEVIRWLNRAYESRDFEFLFFVADPVFNELSTDPRFIELRSRFLR